MNIQTRAKAALISTFLQTAINPNFIRNHYHNYLYRYFILGERFPKPDIPPNFAGDFFPSIRRLKDSQINIEECDLKNVQKFLMKEILKERDPDLTNEDEESDDQMIPLKCEINGR